MASLTPEGPAAIEDPGVRDALKAYRRRSRWILLGSVFLLVAFVWAVDVVDTRRQDLEARATRTEGRILAYRTGGRVVSGTVDVEFGHAGTRRIETLHLDDESPEYEVGQVVEVLIDPEDPEHVALEGETNQSPWTVWPMIIALIAGGGGTTTASWSLGRAWRQRRLLSRNRWRTVKVKYREIPGPRGSVRPLVLVDDRGSEHLLTLASTLQAKLRRTGLRTATETELVGEVPGYVVLRAAGSELLVSARPPVTRRACRRWLKAFRQTPPEWA